MKHLHTNILSYIGYAFGALVLVFTAFNTYSLLLAASGGQHFIAAIGLILFEGGMLFWWWTFQSSADGLPQMALSMIMAIFGLMAVGVATALHLGAVSPDAFGANTPAKLVSIAAFLNLAAKFLFPLVHPDTATTIQRKALQGKIQAQTFLKFDSKVNEMSGQIADDLANDLVEEMKTAISNRRPKSQLMIEVTPMPTIEPLTPTRPAVMAAEALKYEAPAIIETAEPTEVFTPAG